MAFQESGYLDLSNHAKQAGLGVPLRLSEATWERCVNGARNEDTSRWDLAWMLVAEIRMQGPEAIASGIRYSVDLELDKDGPSDVVQLVARVEELDGVPIVRIRLPFEIESRHPKDQLARTLAQSRAAISRGELTPVERVYFFPSDCLDGHELWSKDEGEFNWELRTELYVSDRVDRQAPLITKLLPFLRKHRHGLITCETRAEAAALTKVLNAAGEANEEAPLRFGLGSYPEVRGADKALRQVWSALEADEVQYLIAAKNFDREFLPQWSLWIDLCRWCSPLMFTRRLQNLCSLCIGKIYAEAVSFQVLSSESLEEQIVLCEAIRTRAFQARFGEKEDEEFYRECVEARWAQLLRLAGRPV